jgi:hypothetical protein
VFTIDCSANCGKCKSCEVAYKREWGQRNKERIKQQYGRAHYLAAKEYKAKYYADPNNYKNHQDKHNASTRARRATPKGNLIRKCRKSANYLMEDRDHGKAITAMTVVGCIAEQFKEHLYSGFMRRYGRLPTSGDTVQMDHIIPFISTDDLDTILALGHYTNIQLLLKEDHMEKTRVELLENKAWNKGGK